MRLALLCLVACATPRATPTPRVRDGQHDFDFHDGAWKTKLRRLVKPLSGSTEWAAYEGTTTVRKVWDGRANLVELVADGPAGRLELLSLRLYNPETRQWNLNVASARGGELGPPAVGGFERGRGEFISKEMLGDRPILVRFVISDITPTSAHFEQAFSADGGNTWEVNWIADDERTAMTCCPILELRQYTLKPGQRDTLIELFDREFVEPQEAAGIRVVGQFRDTARPDRFVWIRGFPDMAARAASLATFYGGPVWKQHRDAANATMLDSDNVLLLRPIGNPSFDEPHDGATYPVTIYYFDDRPSDELLARFGPEHDEHVLALAHRQLRERIRAVLGREAAGTRPAPPPDVVFARPPETLELAPTARSRLR